MDFTRRFFIGGAASFSALAAYRAFTAPAGAFSGGTPKLRIGVISDIHCDAAKGDFRIFGDTRTFVKALKYFRACGVDGVILAGDMADNGMRNQLEVVADAWYSVFPDDKGADGRHVEKLFIYGNHDLEDQVGHSFHVRFQHRESFEREWIVRNPGKAWEDFFHEPYAPIWNKTVKGYRFIGAHWKAMHGEGVAEIEPYMKEHAKEIDPSLPFFYIQHPHPMNTCHLGHAWGQDKGFATRALSPFPNAIAFSGHSHTSLTDETTVWQGAFTSIGTSTLRVGGGYGPAVGATGYENCGGKMMRNYEGNWEARQGMVMSVFADHVTLERRDFLRDEPLGDDWVFPLPAAESRPFAPAANKLARTPPEFPDGATGTVSACRRKPRKGGDEVDCLVFGFPAATGVAGARTWDWVITCEQGGAEQFVRYAMDYNNRNSAKRAQSPVELVLPKSYFPAGESVVRVSPRSINGLVGKPLAFKVNVTL